MGVIGTMKVIELVIGIALLLLTVVLVTSVLMQSGKDKKLSGSIAGGAETFFGKTKGKKADKILSKVTTVLSFVFGILMIVLYIFLAKVCYSKRMHNRISKGKRHRWNLEKKNHVQSSCVFSPS